MDLLPDRALLEARRDLLLVLLRDHNLLVAVYPHLLALSLAFRRDRGEPPLPLRRWRGPLPRRSLFPCSSAVGGACV